MILAILVQSQEVGDLTQAQFGELLTSLGYELPLTKEQYIIKVRQGKTTFSVTFGIGEESIVHVATARAEFDVDKTLPLNHLREWAEQNSVKAYSFLGGRIALTAHLCYTTTTRDQLKKNIDGFFKACNSLVTELKPFKVKSSEQINQIGRAPLDLSAKVEHLNPQDFDYLASKLKWGGPAPVAAMRGWITSAHPLGVPIAFSGMEGSKPGFDLTFMRRLEGKQLEDWRKREKPIDWATATEQDGFLYIQLHIDTTAGITVRELRDKILDFTSKVKSLGITAPTQKHFPL
jgi:hypothetical protein